MLSPWMRGSLVLLGLILSARQTHAQAAADAALAATAVKLLPEETIATITVWPSKTAHLPRFSLAPLEIISASGLEEIGIDPLKIQRLDVMVGMPGPLGPQFGAVVQMAEAVSLNDLNIELFADSEEQDDKGFKFRTFNGPSDPEIIFHQASPTAILIGTQPFVKRMIGKRREPTSLTKTLTGSASGSDALVAISIKPIEPLLSGGIESMAEQFPPEIVKDAQTIVKSTDFTALRLTLDDKERLQWITVAINEADAKPLETSLTNVLRFACEQAAEGMKITIPQDGSATTEAGRNYVDRVSGAISNMLVPKRDGKRLVLDVEGFENAATIGTLVGMVMPAVEAARFAAIRAQGSNNLRQLGLAMHNFESAYRKLPATAILEKDTGKPMLSWRVAILPFIEEAQLYNEFHLDEPWDSDHNIKLLERMPAAFKNKGRKLKPGYTCFVVPVNDTTLLRVDEFSKFAEITDGTSNTIMIVEASDEAAVPWTKPEDLEVDPENPHAKLGNAGARVFEALFGDGSSTKIPLDIDADTLNAMFTRAGGEVINNFPR